MDYENEKLLKLIFPQGVPGNVFFFKLFIVLLPHYQIISTLFLPISLAL